MMKLLVSTNNLVNALAKISSGRLGGLREGGEDGEATGWGNFGHSSRNLSLSAVPYFEIPIGARIKDPFEILPSNLHGHHTKMPIPISPYFLVITFEPRGKPSSS